MSNASDFIIENGVLKKYVGPGGDVVIPDGVSRIGVRVFEGSFGLTSVLIPDSVTSISVRAFKACRNLTSVTIPESVTSIGKDAFRECGNLTLFLPGNLQKTEPAFAKCVCRVKLKRWSPEITTLLKGCSIEAIDIEDFLSLPTAQRLNTALKLIADTAFDWDSVCGKGCLDYLTKSAAKLCATAFDHPALLLFLCDRGLLKAKDLDVFLEEAEKHSDTESIALILNYQNTLGDDVLSKAREDKEKKKDDYTDALIERIAARDPSKGIEGMTFVITGRLSFAWESRKEAQSYLEEYGAKLGSSITKQTDYLVTNDTNSGSEKNRKAKEVGALIITEEEFNEMIGWRYKDRSQVTIQSWIKRIPNHAFGGKKKLTSVTIPSSVLSIGTKAFEWCESLTDITLSEGLISIGEDAFSFCRSLTDVTLPDSLCTIERGAFSCCRNLSRIDLPKTVTRIGSAAFLRCEKLMSITIPEGVTRIEDSTFSGCSMLGSVILPESLSEIDDCAFSGCECLKEIQLSDSLRTIGGAAFQSCGLTHIEVPEGVEAIGSYTFNGCTCLKSVSIPNTIKTIESNAFCACNSLMSVAIPGSVTRIGGNAFEKCSSLTNILVSKENTAYCDIDGVLLSKDEKMLYCFPNGRKGAYSLPNSVTSIGGHAFSDCRSLTSVTIPGSVTSIDDWTFDNCSSLRSITIPTSVRNIGRRAFQDCPKLTIHAPAGSYAEQYANENNIPFVAK